MQQQNQFRKGANQIKLTIKSFPLHTERDSFLTYNLYREDPLKGIESSNILFNPCVRQGCNTTCYFDSDQRNLKLYSDPCSTCGNFNSKIYFDVGFKQFIRQQQKYITHNRPLSVDINAKSMQFYFSSRGIKNDMLGRISEYIGNTIVDEMAFDQIPLVSKRTLDFSAIDQKIKEVFVRKYQKQSYYLYSFCKYHPQPFETKDTNYILLFLHGSQSPVKVSLLSDDSRPICSLRTYLGDCKIGYVSASSTFVFEIPKKQGTKYYVSSLIYHFNMEQQSMMLLEMSEWKEPVGRFNGSLIVDQQQNSFYVVGGYDYQRQELPTYIVAFQQCSWYLVDNQYRFRAERTTPQKKQHKNSLNNQSLASKNSAFMLYSIRKLQLQPQSEADDKFLLSLGGSFKDFSIFASGTDKKQKNNIRFLSLTNLKHSKPVIYQRTLLKFTFPLQNYLILECPYLRFSDKYRHHALVFGGYRQILGKDGKRVEQASKEIYLLDTKHLNECTLLQQKFEFGHLLSHNLDSFSTLLYDEKTKAYYIRATYPVDKPIKFKNGEYLHYLIVEFDLTEKQFRVLPGLMQQI